MVMTMARTPSLKASSLPVSTVRSRRPAVPRRRRPAPARATSAWATRRAVGGVTTRGVGARRREVDLPDGARRLRLGDVRREGDRQRVPHRRSASRALDVEGDRLLVRARPPRNPGRCGPRPAWDRHRTGSRSSASDIARRRLQVSRSLRPREIERRGRRPWAPPGRSGPTAGRTPDQRQAGDDEGDERKAANDATTPAQRLPRRARRARGSHARSAGASRGPTMRTSFDFLRPAGSRRASTRTDSEKLSTDRFLATSSW